MTHDTPIRHVIAYSHEAAAALRRVRGKDDRKRIADRIQALKVFPQMGAAYDPPYEAMVPRHSLRVTYAGNHGIYYTIDEAKRRVNVEHLEDQRNNPTNRFDGYPPPYAP